MGWGNPPVRWSELERTLSGRPPQPGSGDGGDSPAWGRKRTEYESPPETRPKAIERQAEQRVPYAEVHSHSNFSFLDGASHPEELVEQAARLGLDAIALTDHDGMYGVVRFAEAAKELGVHTAYGAELSFGLPAPQNGVADPVGEHLVLLARKQPGYHKLCSTITAGQLGPDPDRPGRRENEKGRPIYDLDRVVEDVRDHCAVLTGCRKSPVRRALDNHGPAAAADQLRFLSDRFGQENVYVELIDHGMPEDSTRNDLLAAIAADLRLPVIASNAVHYAHPSRGRLATTVAAVRARRSLYEMDGWLPPAPMAYLRSGAEMADRFRRYPGVIEQTAVLGMECSFDLALVAPKLPPFPVPDDLTETTYLRKLVYYGAAHKFGAEAENPKAYAQIRHELNVIESLGFPGYFLIVWDIVQFCRAKQILCQGRGSAANSAVCFALGITNVDAIRYDLLFERFLAPERDGYPDIDLDIESDRREEAIQYVYERYGRLCSAQVANVITYRGRSAIRDTAKALGYSTGQQDAWSRQLDRWGPLERADKEDLDDIPDVVKDLAKQLEDFPRHLGIHSGGMVICDRPVSEVCPVEWARMENRSVLQWDKDDCAAAGLVKFDLLGLGMLSALHYAIDLVHQYEGKSVDISNLDLTDKNIYQMLSKADSVGVFQVESRAQMATLPRLRPNKFYDLVVEVALIRPGPIQGGSVHPYISRHTEESSGRPPSWNYDHPLLEKALKKTLGVPLFQEQMMQIAVDVANFTAADADQLRRAMGARRSAEKMAKLRDRLYSGMAVNGITGDLADRIYEKLLAFANFGFPESHALSFAHLVFSSAYFKYYHPAAFCAALLRAQPMGFYSPQSLVADARRHGVIVHGPDINKSLTHPTLEPASDSTGGLAVRLGLAATRRIGDTLADEITHERNKNGPYTDLMDLSRRINMNTPQWEALATAGAFSEFNLDRRSALWAAGAAAENGPDRLPGTTLGLEPPPLPDMDEIDVAVADVWALGMSPTSFPIEFVRDRLTELGALPASDLAQVESGTRVLVGGAVTHRQRPATAGGVTFLNVEDETGMVNVVCTLNLWRRYRKIARNSAALLVRGILQNVDGALSLVADHLETLDLRTSTPKSRDFR